VIVVTRHPSLVDLLREEGVISGDVRVIPHATPEDVEGQVVVGVLPLHLAALAREVIVPVLELRPEDRGRELSLDELRERFRGVERYVVRPPEKVYPVAFKSATGFYDAAGRFGIATAVPLGGGQTYARGKMVLPWANTKNDVPDPSGLSPEEILGHRGDLDYLEDLLNEGVQITWKGSSAGGVLFNDPTIKIGDKVMAEGSGWIPLGLLFWLADWLKANKKANKEVA